MSVLRRCAASPQLMAFALAVAVAHPLYADDAPAPAAAPTAIAPLPVGMVVAFAGETPPPGWLLCDGHAVSADVFPALFVAIGYAHGRGGEEGVFNLPDYRGRFLRGVDGGAGVDPDRRSRAAMKPGGNTGDKVGSVQGDAVGAHKHGLPGNNDWIETNMAKQLVGNRVLVRQVGALGAMVDRRASGGSTVAVGGAETRPVNASVNWIIFAGGTPPGGDD